MRPTRRKVVLLLGFIFIFSAPTLKADTWEFAMKVRYSTQYVQVYLYHREDVSTPFRQATVNTTVDLNFQCDIDDNDDNNATWPPISYGTGYYLRVAGRYASLWIDEAPLKTDFELYFDGSNFSILDDSHGIVHLGATLDWTDQKASVLVDQTLSGSGTSVDSIGHWQGGAEFKTYIAPKQFTFLLGTTEVLRTPQRLISQQKFATWSKDDTLINHRVFGISQGFPGRLVAQFNGIEPSITIKSGLLDAPGAMGGDVQFRDPWYIDSFDAQHGNHWQNRGMTNAVNYARSVGTAGFKPDTSTIYSGSPYPYLGVFLNQGGPDPHNLTPPYYSVGAPNTTTILGFSSYFVRWTGYSAQFQDSLALQTPIVFQGSLAGVTALYKAHLGTGNTSISNAINQRRVVSSTSGSWFLLYESMGDVWLTYSGDNGQTWQVEERMNIIQGQASSPTISNVYGPSSRVIMSWLEQNGSTTELHVQTMLITSQPYFGWNASGGTRSSDNHAVLKNAPFYFSAPRSDARPALELESDGSGGVLLTIAYERSAGIFLGKIDIPNELLSASVYDVRSVSTPSGDSYPVIISYPSAFGYPARQCVYYLGTGYASGKRVVEYDYATQSHTVIPGGSGDYTYYSLQGAPNPSGASFALVAEGTNTTNYFVNYYTKETYLGTSPPHLNTAYTNMRQPTIMVQNSSAFGSATTEVDMRAASSETWYKGGSVNLTSYTSNKAGVFARDIVLPSDRASVITRDTTVAPYHLSFYSGVGNFMKVDNSEPVDIRAVRFWTQDNSTVYPAFLDFSGDAVSLIDTLESGRTVCVAQIISPSAAGQIVQQVDSLMLPLQVDLIRAGKVIRSLAASTWSALSVGTLPQFLPGDILRFSLVPGAKKVRGYTEVSLRNSVGQKQAMNDHSGETPSSFALSSYPNPFNPTTTIIYDLPTDGHVSMIVYDVLGRQVVDLANSDLDAGSYSHVWNATNQSGAHVASGIYFIRLSVTDKLGSLKFAKTDKIVLMK